MKSEAREQIDPLDLMTSFAEKTSKLRAEGSFEGIEDGNGDVMTVQHYLLALSCLEQAERHFKLARFHQVRANASRGY